MPFWSTTMALMCLAAAATGVTVARHGQPGSKHNSLFETADGERTIPFSAVSAGAASRDECIECGATLDSLSEEFCVSCGVAVVADD